MTAPALALAATTASSDDAASSRLPPAPLRNRCAACFAPSASRRPKADGFALSFAAQVDAIILCTGYQHHFPFMHPSLRLQTPNRLCCNALHEGNAARRNGEVPPLP